VGYVAGFLEANQNNKKVKHLVINGAFNPGNSGGPLFVSNDNKVIGVVVAKYILYPPMVEQVIHALENQKSGFVYTAVDPQGNKVDYSEGQLVGMVLEQFYRTAQVMIGQAISVSELRSFLKAKESELAPPTK
jgi:S1-C subfamily serine protease